MVSIVGTEIHEYLQTTDKEALLDKDEDGEHVPLLLSTLDLSHWTLILVVSITNNGVEKALGRLREAYGVLANLLEKDELELEEATVNTWAVETALGAANLHEDWSGRPAASSAKDTIATMHPILGRLNIPQAKKAAIEDYSETIQITQIENVLALQDANNRGPAIRFLHPRIVEVRLNNRSHCTWCLHNINLLAPIHIARKS
jgi:hypothetical protein